MFFILLLFRALFAAGVQTLTIDSQLGTSIEDCFERISIGERIPIDAVYRNVSELTTKECEQICKQDKQCQTYDYGVGAKGNATCNLSKVDEKEIKEKNILQRHPDYDVYVRRFQCEQSPPTPMEIAMDDPDANPPEGGDRDGQNTPNGHRPVFRPGDENVPPSDDYLVSSNLQYRPDYHNQPNVGSGYRNPRPQDVGYGPQRPGYKPDPYDEISFQDYNKHKDPYGAEKPNYNYIIRPTRRPYQVKQDPYAPNHDTGPVGPTERPYRPSRPYDRPSQNYGENDIQVEIYDPQYGSHGRPSSNSNYGQGSNQHGSQSYGEHRPDPAYGPMADRPGYGHLGAGYASEHGYGLYKPSKPADTYNGGQSGYNNQASYGSGQSNFGSNQASYGSNQGTYGSNRPYSQDSGYVKPDDPYKKPVYSNQASYVTNQVSHASNQESYGSSHNHYNSNYGSNRPANDNTGIYNKPLYGNDHGLYGNHNNLYGDYGSNQGLYASSHGAYNQAYGTNQGYGNNGYGSGNYGTQSSDGSSQSNYGAAQSSYGSHASHNDRLYNKPAYSNDKPSYSNDKPTYGNKPSYNDRPAYPSSNPSYGSKRPGYGGDTNYDNDRPDYGSQRPAYVPDRPSYDSTASYNDKPGYGNQSPTYSDKPSYNNDRPNYSSDKPAYGSDRPSYSSDRPAYGSDRPSYSSDRPSYAEKPIYGDDKPSYGTERPTYVSQKPLYGSDPIYGNEKPYGNDKISYDKPSYGSGSSYGSSSSRPYDSQKPSYGTEKPFDSDSYGSERPSYDSQSPGYGSQKPSYTQAEPAYSSEPSYVSIKPKPSYANQPYGNSRPSYENDRPGYGLEPAYGSYRPGYDKEQQIYGHRRPSYADKNYGNDRYGTHGSYGSQAVNDHQASYGSSQASYTSNQASYGSNQASYSSNRVGYDNNQDRYNSQGGYGSNQGGYGTNQGSYNSNNNNQASYDSNQASYGTNHASYGANDASYSNKRPAYSDNQNTYGSSPVSYGNNQASYDKPQSSYGSNQAGYSNNQASYGSNQSSYGSNQASYGMNQDSYGNNQASYTTSKPSYSDPPSHTSQPSYGGQQADSLNETGYPVIKPVYEYENRRDGPSYGSHPNGDIVSSRPMAVGDFGDRAGGRAPSNMNNAACFRRVLAGKRTLRSFVQKAVACESLEECRRECAMERRFPCESFNYRIDNSFRGRGLCELMTKPIEAFDVRRDFVDDKDFDFYELDRNSLEPNCPDTLRGAGILHSGFLSSKPERQGSGQWDRGDFDRDNKRNFDDRQSDRRHDDRHFVPYQIGTTRPNEDHSRWGQYGGSYGGSGSYYKHREDYHNSVNHWRISDQDRRYGDYGVKPLSGSSFDYHSLAKDEDMWKDNRYGHGSWKKGSWNNSGVSRNGLEHEEPDFHEHNHLEEIERSDEPPAKDCSSRRSPGMSLGTGAIRRSIFARNVVDCETACFAEREFKCVSYSYRYSNSHGSDNCFLSERPYRGLELSADSGSDVYAMPQDHDCVTINHKPWVESECFWHVKSGAAVDGEVARAALTVTGLGACEAECIRAQGFFCRGFSFRFDSPTIGEDLENCILTSSPPTSLENGRGLRPSPGHELYARGNYGRGCEPALYDDSQHVETQCYLQYDNSARLTPSATRGRAKAKDEMSCGKVCTDAPFRCLSFSYSNNAPPDTDNCLLSEIRLFDLHEGVDYVHSTDDWLFAFDLFNGQCWRKVHGEGDYEEPSSELPRPIPISGADHHKPYISSGPPSGPPGPPGPTGIGFLPETHDHISSGPPGSFKPGSDHKPGYPESGPGPRPGFLSEPSHYSHPKPSYPPEDYKPSFPELDFRPSHGRPDSSYLDHKPVHPPDFDFKPGFPEIDYKPTLSEPGYSSGYRPESNYKPNYQPIEPELKPGFRPDYKPTYSSRPGQEDYRPGYLEDSKPVYRPRPPEFDNFKPGYSPEAYKPSYPPRPQQSNYRPAYHDEKPVYRPRPDSQDQLNFKPDYPVDNRPFYPTRLPDTEKPYQSGFRPNIGPDYQQKPFRPESKPIGRPGPYVDRKPARPVYQTDREDNEPMSVSWSHYTVSGFPCKSGTSCAQNVIAGHWACEPEGGEIGAWDYCCAPTHRCGYSEGFHKPWCYVGPSEDQWRPCSEKYYPYHQHNVPHPSQGHTDSRPVSSEDRPPSYIADRDRKYWDNLHKNGPQAYYDKHGNPLPGYSRVPTEDRSNAKNQHNYPAPGSGNWVQVPALQTEGQPAPGTLGVPRYWPVAYLHKGPPPNMTYFRYNETTTTERIFQNTPFGRELPDSTPLSINNGDSNYDHTDKNDHDPSIDNKETDKDTYHHTTDKNDEKPNIDFTTESSHRDDKKRNISNSDINNTQNDTKTTTTTTTEKIMLETTEKLIEASNVSDVESSREDVIYDKDDDSIKGIDDKLDDFSSVEVVDLDSKSIKTIEEEKQIEEIGRLLAARRGGKLILENHTQKDLETRKISLDKELSEFNFRNRFPSPERRGIVQKVTKEEINRDRKELSNDRLTDKSLEVSETTYVRPPRVLSTTENIRKAIVNGKVFYDASVRAQRDLFNAMGRSKSLNSTEERIKERPSNTDLYNFTRRNKGLNPIEDRDKERLNTELFNAAKRRKRLNPLEERPVNTFGKKVFNRNVNPVRRVRRVFKKRYNPDEVRRRLLEREKSLKGIETTRKI